MIGYMYMYHVNIYIIRYIAGNINRTACRYSAVVSRCC